MRDVVIDPAQLVSDHLVAAAIEARAEAKRQVYIDGQRTALEHPVAGLGGNFVRIGSKPVVKLTSGWIRSVAGPLAIVALHDARIKGHRRAFHISSPGGR